MTLSPLALWTLENYLRRRREPALPKYLELTERGIELKELPLLIRRPSALDLLRAPRYRLYDPISPGVELMRARLWVDPAYAQKTEEWMQPYRHIELDFGKFIDENGLSFLFQESITILEINPKMVEDMLRDRFARTKLPIKVWSRGDIVYYAYSNYEGWSIDLASGEIQVYYKRPDEKPVANPEMLMWNIRDRVFGALYYSGIADTRELRAEAKREYRHLGGA